MSSLPTKSALADAVPGAAPEVVRLRELWRDILCMVILALEDELRARTRKGRLRARKWLAGRHRDCWDAMDKIASYAERAGAAPDDIDGLPCHSEMGIIIDAVIPGETLIERKFDIEKAVGLIRSTDLRVMES